MVRQGRLEIAKPASIVNLRTERETGQHADYQAKRAQFCAGAYPELCERDACKRRFRKRERETTEVMTPLVVSLALAERPL